MDVGSPVMLIMALETAGRDYPRPAAILGVSCFRLKALHYFFDGTR